MQQAEKDLILRCQKGSRKAQEKIYLKYAPKMYGVCFRYVKNEMEADDVLQEGFIKVFSSIKQYKFEGSFEGWLRRIVITTAINIYRKSIHFHNEYDIEVAENLIGDNFGIIDKISADEIVEMIQALPNGYRMIFNLYAVEGYTHKEIGDMLGVSENTSKSQLSRARKILQKKILSRTNKTIASTYEG